MPNLITIVVSIQNWEIFKNRLWWSLTREKVPFNLCITPSWLRIAESYNTIGNIESDYLMICHQDVRFAEENFLEKVEEIANSLENFGIGGVTGWRLEQKRMIGGLYRNRHGKPKKILLYDQKFKVRKYGSFLAEAKKVQIVDDMIFLIKKEFWNQVKFDTRYWFHLVGEDYCMEAKKRGFEVYVLPVRIWTIRSEGSANKAHKGTKEAKKKFREKWKNKQNVWTCIGLIERVIS